MNELEQSLTEAIKRREADWIDLWRDLVNCDSGTYNKDEADRAGSILAKAVSDLGFTAERVPQKQFGDHVVARKPGSGAKRLLFIGHFDTVFPRGTVKERPFTIKGDKATGPGVSDMKGGLAVMIAALKRAEGDRLAALGRCLAHHDLQQRRGDSVADLAPGHRGRSTKGRHRLRAGASASRR